jgi:HEAT repeat protein
MADDFDGYPEEHDAKLSAGQLLEKIGNSNWRVREAASNALASMGAQVVEPLCAKLWDGAPEVRCAAADTLGRIGDLRALDPLMARLEDDDISVRETVAEAVAKICAAASPQALTHVQRAVKTVAAGDFSMGAAGGASAISLLIMKIWEPDETVRTAAADALVKIGAPAVEQLIKALNVAEPEMTELGVFDPDYILRATAARTLGRIGDKRAVEPLVARLTEPRVGVRIAAINALAKLGDARAVEPLCSVLFCGDSNVNVAAAKALGLIGDARAVEPLKRLLPKADEYCLKIVHEALDRIHAR